MAIVIDKKRNRYYINYKYTAILGERLNVNIRDKTWIVSGVGHVTKRYMQSIEKTEIAKDKAKRDSDNHLEDKGLKLEDLIKLFFSVEAANNLDYETLYSYNLNNKNYLFKIIPQNTPVKRTFTVTNMDKYRILLSEQGFVDRTINNKLVCVRKLIKFGIVRKFIPRETGAEAIDLLAPIKERKRSVQFSNFFQNGNDDFQKFIHTFDEEDKHWRIPVLTLFYGALRIGEWQAIRRWKCDFEKCVILINSQIDNHGREKKYTKNGEDKLVKFPKPFMDELKKYVDDRQISNNEFIFIGERGGHMSRHALRNMLDKHVKISGLQHITPHGLRHSFATRMFDKGYDIKEVQMHLGHKSMDTTMRYYIHFTNSKSEKDRNDLL